MLVLKRRDGEWIEIKHRSGDVLRVRVYNIEADFPPTAIRPDPDDATPADSLRHRGRFPAHCNLAFDDAARNFDIQRPERFTTGASLAQPQKQE